MTTRETPFAPGTPCWVDLFSSDVGRAKTFYGSLLDWTVEEPGEEFGGYVNFRSEGHRVAGLMQNTPESGSPDGWSTYFSTPDIEATVAAATDAGAHVLASAMEVSDLGSMAVVSDPAGAVVGLWQPGSHLGFTKYGAPGSVSWNEQYSKDFAASMAFYQTVFGWQIESMADSDEFRYSTGQVEGRDVAGLMDARTFLPAGAPSYWSVYFDVVDVDAAVATVEELGGAVVRVPEDSPYGQIAEVADPTGAQFRLRQAPPEPA